MNRAQERVDRGGRPLPEASGPDAPQSARRLPSRRDTLAVAVIVAGGAGACVVAARSRSDRTRASAASTFSGATAPVVRGDLEGSTNVSGTLRYADAHRFRSHFEGVVTQLASAGTVVHPGEVVMRVGAEPTFLMNGTTPSWRDLEVGVGDGEDVRQLEAALHGMGHLATEPDSRFTWATANAVMAWQGSQGMERTGTVPLGRVIFSAGDLRIGKVLTRVGDRVGTDTEVYDVTSTSQVVEADVKLADQQLAVVGTQVSLRLPGAVTTTGTISSVGTPTERTTQNSSTENIIPITVALDDPQAASNLQEASVTVSLPSQRREDVLSVPVGALLALGPQQFGVEVVDSRGSTRKVVVTTGLFTSERVEVSGEGLSEGQQVVVPR